MVWLPLVQASEVVVDEKKISMDGQLEAGQFDTYILPDGQGRSLTYTVEPNLTYSQFDIYIFSQTQYLEYVSGAQRPGAQHSNLKVWRQEDRIEDFEKGWALVVDNTNMTAAGAQAEGPLAYSITLEIESKPFWERYGWTLLGAMLLVFVLLLVYVVWRRSSRTKHTMPGPTSHHPEGPDRTSGDSPGLPPPPHSASTPGMTEAMRPPSTHRTSASSGNEYRQPAETASQPPPHPPNSASTSGPRPMLVECPGCGTRIEYDRQANEGRITCTACGLSGKVD